MSPLPRCRWIVWTLLIIAGSTCCGAQSIERTREPAPADGVALRVHGRVITSAGAPLPGAHVVLRAKIGGQQYTSGLQHNRDVLARTTTNAQGRFFLPDVGIPLRLGEVINNLQRGNAAVQLLVWGEGYGLAWRDIASLEPPEITLELSPEVVVAGRVQSPEGEGLAGVKISLRGGTSSRTRIDHREEPDGLCLSLSEFNDLSVVTAADGGFRMRNLPVDRRLLLFLDKLDWGASTVLIDTDPSGTHPQLTYEPLRKVLTIHRSPTTFELPRQSCLPVRVRDHTGAPVQGGAVEAVTADRGFAGWSAIDESGTAWLKLHAGGPLTLFVGCDPLAPRLCVTVADVAPEGEPPAPVTVRLPEPRWISGRVVDRDTGAPIAGAYLRYSLQPPLGKREADTYSEAVSDVQGHFRLPAAPGQGSVTFVHSLYGYWLEPHQLAPVGLAAARLNRVDVPAEGDLPPLELKVSRGLIVCGCIRHPDGQPAAYALVRADNRERGVWKTHATTTADGQGRYQLAGWSPHLAMTISAIHGTGTVRQILPGDPGRHWNDGARTVELDLMLRPAIVLRGRVLHDGRPAPGVRLQLYQSALDNENSFHPLLEVVTNEAGEYRAFGLEPGDRYFFHLHAPDGLIATEWRHASPFIQTVPTTAASEEIELPDLTLFSAGQTLRGQVVDRRGRGVADVTVSPSLVSGGRIPRPPRGPAPWTKTDAEGRFELTDLPDQPIELMAYKAPPGGEYIRFPAKVRPALNQTDIRILLDPDLHTPLEDLEASP